MGSLSFAHLLLILVILLLFFGPSKLPQLGQSIGKALKGFKEGLNEINSESSDTANNKNQSQINHQAKTNSEPAKSQSEEIKKS